MRRNIVQTPSDTKDGRTSLAYDWFDKGIPANVKISSQAFIDTSYGFAGFHSLLPEAMLIGKGSGCYDRASFIVGENGKIEIGDFNILNGSLFICSQKIVVGNHCMFAWGSVITDSWDNTLLSHPAKRRHILAATAQSALRLLPVLTNAEPVNIEDNVWVGFDTVVLPGVRLGRGCVIGSKSVITNDIPPYAVVVGNPSKIVRYLEPDDTNEVKELAMQELLA